jgi:hypothetical protein
MAGLVSACWTPWRAESLRKRTGWLAVWRGPSSVWTTLVVESRTSPVAVCTFRPWSPTTTSPMVGARKSATPASTAPWPLNLALSAARPRDALASRRAGRRGPMVDPGDTAPTLASVTRLAATPRAEERAGPTQATTGTVDRRTDRSSAAGSESRAPSESIWRMTTLAPARGDSARVVVMRSKTTGSMAPSTWTTSMWRSAAGAARAGPAGVQAAASNTRAARGRRTGDP